MSPLPHLQLHGVGDLVRPGLRRNPRRAHLLVSTVLGKHLPTAPQVVLDAGNRLGDRVAATLAGTPAAVFGFAETATALGHNVADRISAPVYLHSTRRAVPGVVPAGRFEEGHSHATDHLLLPVPADLFDTDLPLVLVDDEISTGATALDAIAALHRRRPRDRYVIASLVDLRTPASRAATAAVATALGVTIDTVCLAAGSIDLPDGLIDAVAALPEPELNPIAPQRGRTARVELPWPATVPDGGRHGVPSADRDRFTIAAGAAAETLARALPTDRPALVIGHEELMYLPLRIAAILAEHGRTVRFQTTTRSPGYVADRSGYPLRRGFRFTAPELGESAPRYLYNAGWPDADPVVVLIIDPPADTPALTEPGGLVDVLTAAGTDVVVAALPGVDPAALRAARTAAPLTGPGFGSYAADEVAWLVQDLSAVRLEAPTIERERRIQSGAAHYAESLPVEYQPDAAYRALFDRALADSARRLALAVATVTELVLAERGTEIVLASLARAGTPIGILMRRWAGYRGHPVPHYTLSIVRDRGIDPVALDYLVRHHDPSSVVFVDGWTGKGAIARELTAALAGYRAAGGPAFDDDLAVLADPGYCVRTFGTRDDFLIASACLNSTVSGLVSRTVLNPQLIGPGEFHGAKFYPELAPDDVSNVLLDTVSAEFGAIAGQVPGAG
ncbi:phosphoribosyltransferase domain-containing protein, partial [Skermania piniformis]|uniref:phosphoribosyltransferase domain-containing protein n=1 Tax=Skermania pinensis TaxID=39122 RepID=UPI0039E94009